MNMSTSIALDVFAQLPHTTATDVKKIGWRGLMKAVRSHGKTVVTNHNEPEAVILSTEEYAEIMKIVAQSSSQTESALESLRQQFDVRLASLQEHDANKRLRAIMRGTAKLGGKVKVGASY